MSSETEKRVQALEQYNILDTPPELAYDDLTHLASFICKTPISLISLLDSERQWFKSKVGLTVDETPIEHAFCAHAIQEPEVFVITDATKDPRFADNPLVTSDPYIRFYAGAPLITPEGVSLGTLCAIDKKAREITEEQKEALTALARQAVIHLELRRALIELTQSKEEIDELQAILPICTYCKKIRDDENFWQQVDQYFTSHSDIKFSHGICPECFPDVLKNAESKTRDI